MSDTPVVDDLLEGMRVALGGTGPILLPEQYAMPSDVAAAFVVYMDGQHARKVEYEGLLARSVELANETTAAKNAWFQYLHDHPQMMHLRGKPVQMNTDGTYQLFAEVIAPGGET